MSTNINLLKALSQILFSATHEQLPVTSRGVSHVQTPRSPGARLLQAPGRVSCRGGLAGWPHGLAWAPGPGRRARPERRPLSAPGFHLPRAPGPLTAAPCLARAPWSSAHAGVGLEGARGGRTPPPPASSQAGPLTRPAPVSAARVSFTPSVWTGRIHTTGHTQTHTHVCA